MSQGLPPAREPHDEGAWLASHPPVLPAPHRAEWPGIQVERAWLRPPGPVSFAFDGPHLMLRLGEAGRRLDGETFLSDGSRSTARPMGGRLHICPPGLRLHGWSRPAGAWAYTAIYLDTARIGAEYGLARVGARRCTCRRACRTTSTMPERCRCAC